MASTANTQMKRLFILFLLFFYTVIFFEKGSAGDEKKEMLKSILQHFKERYAPDDRLSVFTLKAKYKGNSIYLEGDIDNSLAKKILLDSVHRATGMEVFDDVVVLPSPTLGTERWGIVTMSVADVRKEPDNRKEMVTQVLMGTRIELLKEGKLFWLVRLPDGYVGWLKRSAFARMTKEEVEQWEHSLRVIVTTYFGIIRSLPTETSLPISDVVLGCIMKQVDSTDGWIAIELADKRKGYIRTFLVEEVDRWKRSRNFSPATLESTAFQFFGFPYLWGGNSVKGFDCSGFIATVFWLNGKELRRDADMQATMGDSVAAGKNFEGLKKGDLLFFGEAATQKKGERITHVALYLDSLKFIHCSGNVKLSSFDPQSPYYDPALRKNFLKARRIH